MPVTLYKRSYAVSVLVLHPIRVRGRVRARVRARARFHFGILSAPLFVLHVSLQVPALLPTLLPYS